MIGPLIGIIFILIAIVIKANAATTITSDGIVTEPTPAFGPLLGIESFWKEDQQCQENPKFSLTLAVKYFVLKGD